MRTFNLQFKENGQVIVPNAIPTEQAESIINARKGGFVHIVAFTNAKPLKKSYTDNLDIVKIVDCMVIKGRRKDYERTNNQTVIKGKTYKNYFTVEFDNGGNGFVCHLTGNPKHISKSYYIDLNSGRVLDKQYLLENGYISSATSSQPFDNRGFRTFKTNQIIMVK